VTVTKRQAAIAAVLFVVLGVLIAGGVNVVSYAVEWGWKPF
jgi:hypothetical protein